MKKTELSEILHKPGKPVNEGVTDTKNEKTYPRIDYFPIAWSNNMASGEDYSGVDMYQISIYSKTAPNRKTGIVSDIKRILNERGIYPEIYHEFNLEDRLWHSYFEIGVNADD